MRGTSLRRVLALASIVATAALTAACVPPGPVTAPPVPTGNFNFTANQVTVNSSQDYDGPCLFGVCISQPEDEPYVINIGFRVQVGVPGSASTQVVKGDNQWSGLFDQGPGEGDTDVFDAGQSAKVSFNNVPLLDVTDLAFASNHLTITGVWSWAMEADLLGVSGLADASADALKTVLNQFIASSSGSTDASTLINLVLDAITDNLLPSLGGLAASFIPFAGDDALGSRIYIGLGTRGTLSSIADSAISGVSVPSIAIPVLKIPPDILGGQIVTLGNKAFNGQVMQTSGQQGKHTYNLSFNQT
jgi:hypothetical protein